MDWSPVYAFQNIVREQFLIRSTYTLKGEKGESFHAFMLCSGKVDAGVSVEVTVDSRSGVSTQCEYIKGFEMKLYDLVHKWREEGKQDEIKHFFSQPKPSRAALLFESGDQKVARMVNDTHPALLYYYSIVFSEITALRSNPEVSLTMKNPAFFKGLTISILLVRFNGFLRQIHNDTRRRTLGM